MSRPPGKAHGFGAAVQSARLQRGWSQSKAAQAAGLSRPTVSRIELGDPPSMRTARKLATALGLVIEVTSTKTRESYAIQN
ncbi:helix-turn-helix transcriptional regulator [Dietzia kunjamensis]|uniref:helix-turn-helix transcriptional regulator n=1 Tax=Dietzia TaxID=37914 RepID=UPI0022B359C8|nr:MULTISPECIES: helix-turn-helix transcriptional regulator [Dietzia]MCZ4541279.1 helix-turn-helix transcriptional regulator [Dietzia maris]MDJ0424193.1 helix-turn-helix transcriptional regulator [Dietzia kunjamensis]